MKYEDRYDMMDKNEKEIRIREYLSGELSKAEEREFNEWLDGDADAQRIFKERVKQYHLIRWTERWEAIDDEMARKRVVDRVRRHRWRVGFMRYAAVIAVIVVTGLTIWNWPYRSTGSAALTLVSVPAANVPILKLADGKEIPVSPRNMEIIRSTQRVDIQLADSGRLEYVAKSDPEAGQVEYNTLVVPRGCEFNLVLADGSRVWLNSETELRYPVNFTAEKRRVFLKGEAYFEVAKNAQIPFVVTTSAGIDVKVLGTKFNVASYENDEQVTTTLAEGSVEVGDEKGSVRLKPEEQALFCKGDRSLRVQKVDVGMYLAWKDGKFIFEEQSLEQIMKQLQRWYEMSVFYTNEEVKQYTFSGDLKKYDDFDKIIRMLEEVSGIKISIKENCVVIGTK